MLFLKAFIIDVPGLLDNLFYIGISGGSVLINPHLPINLNGSESHSNKD